jgi:hypothetical protein
MLSDWREAIRRRPRIELDAPILWRARACARAPTVHLEGTFEAMLAQPTLFAITRRG